MTIHSTPSPVHSGLVNALITFQTQPRFLSVLGLIPEQLDLLAGLPEDEARRIVTSDQATEFLIA